MMRAPAARESAAVVALVGHRDLTRSGKEWLGIARTQNGEHRFEAAVDIHLGVAQRLCDLFVWQVQLALRLVERLTGQHVQVLVRTCGATG